MKRLVTRAIVGRREGDAYAVSLLEEVRYYRIGVVKEYGDVFPVEVYDGGGTLHIEHDSHEEAHHSWIPKEWLRALIRLVEEYPELLEEKTVSREDYRRLFPEVKPA